MTYQSIFSRQDVYIDTVIYILHFSADIADQNTMWPDKCQTS